MGRLWDRVVGGFRRFVRAPAPPPRRGPWVLVGHLPADPRLQCHFCGREDADLSRRPGRQGESDFALVQARYNPHLQHIVCGDCLNWNRITPA